MGFEMAVGPNSGRVDDQIERAMALGYQVEESISLGLGCEISGDGLDVCRSDPRADETFDEVSVYAAS